MLRGQQIHGTYRIKLATYKQPFDKSIFKEVARLGILFYEEDETGSTKIYLGNYLGANSAEDIRRQANQMGFEDAFVVPVLNSMRGASGEILSHTLQFCAVKNLDMRNYSLDPSLKDDFYIWYYDGLYRLSLGLFANNDKKSIDRYKGKIKSWGFGNCILRLCHSDGQSYYYYLPKPAEEPTTPKTTPTQTSIKPSVGLRPLRLPK